jgi:hypothetical protein
MKYTKDEWILQPLPTTWNMIETEEGTVWGNMTGTVETHDHMEIAQCTCRVNEPGPKDKVNNIKEFRGNLALISKAPVMFALLKNIINRLPIEEIQDGELSGELVAYITQAKQVIDELEKVK